MWLKEGKPGVKGSPVPRWACEKQEESSSLTRVQQFSSTQGHCWTGQAAAPSQRGSQEQPGERVTYSHVQRGRRNLPSCHLRGPGTSGHQLLLPFWHLQPAAKRSIKCTSALQARGVQARTWSNGVKVVLLSAQLHSRF